MIQIAMSRVEKKKGDTMTQKSNEFCREDFSKSVSIWVKKDVYSWREPVHLPGCQYLEGEPETGYVIQNQYTGEEYVAIPVQCLEANGTLDGINYNSKFGRRVFEEDSTGKDFIEKEIRKSSDFISPQALNSINKYGIFYLTRYMASLGEDGIEFVKGKMPVPIIQTCYLSSNHFTYKYVGGEVDTCLPSGAAYDTLCQAIIQLKAQTYDEIVSNSIKLGNYWNSPNSPRKIMPNGSPENGYIFNINGLAGNCGELTNERWGALYFWRGNHYGCRRGYVAQRNVTLLPGSDDYDALSSISFRAMLYLK